LKPKRKKEESTGRENREQEEPKYQETKNIVVERKERGGNEIVDNKCPQKKQIRDRPTASNFFPVYDETETGTKDETNRL